ncbi:hypothetical protein KR009_011536, partial [Drosophila setifemur]
APLKRCKWQDEACIRAQAQTYFRAFKNGIPERQVPPLDPMELGTMRIESGGHSDSLNFRLLMTQAKMHGMSDTVVVKSMKGFHGDLTTPLKLTMVIESPDLEVHAKYDVDGKLLILPIVSKGDIVIKLQGVSARSRILVEPVKRNDGHSYLNITDFKTVSKLKSGSFDLNNLFSENTELRESTLRVLNQEWDALAADVQPAINEACGRTFRAILQSLWQDIPYDEFFEDN